MFTLLSFIDSFLSVKRDSYAFILTPCAIPTERKAPHAFIPTSYLPSRRRDSHAFTSMSKPSLSRRKHSHALRYNGKRRMKEREAGRAEKKRLWHSFLYADVTYWTIDSPRSGFWQGATARLISKFHALSPTRLGLLLKIFKSTKVKETSGD